MCGICGFIGPGGAAILDRMVATLEHRGPDEEGTWVEGDVALGMRRLSIIDLATGQQPVFNETGRIAVIFNGEIYNHAELRQRLRALGHTFRTDHSDTEVISHLYEEMGPGLLDELNGMFAIAVWDSDRRTLLLARDRAGIKPLYWAQVGQGLVFGSEPKALLAHPEVSRAPDLRAIHHFLSLKNIPAPASAFAAIRQLAAGEYLLWTDGQVTVQRWWRLRFAEDPTLTEAEAAHRIRALLEDAVRLQMCSDVPIGAYLSGGVDSSSVVALMAKLGCGRIKTFTLTYGDGHPRKDADRRFAREVASQYGTDHHEYRIDHADLARCLDDISVAFDEPYSGVVSTFFITKCVAQHVKVALSGDGADELFGSYAAHRLAQPLALVAGLGDSPPDADDLRRLAFLGGDWAELKRQVAGGDESARRMALYIADDEAKDSLYTPLFRAAVGQCRTETLIRALYARAGTADPLNRALFVDFESLLPDQVLAFVDRLSMAHSVEVRPPFLDHRLIELAATIPGALKIKGQRVKHILKTAVADLVSPELLDRPKEGFLMPINEWILQHLRPMVEDMLSPGQLARHGLLEQGAVRRVLDAHYGGKANFGNRIWSLMMLQMWWNRYQR